MFTSELKRVVNGANSRMVSIITGKSPHEEAKAGSRSFDLVSVIRARRLTWLGHILRMDQTRLLSRAVRYQFENRCEGDIVEDAPTVTTWEELRAWAADRRKWRARVMKIKRGGGIVSVKWRKSNEPNASKRILRTNGSVQIDNEVEDEKEEVEEEKTDEEDIFAGAEIEAAIDTRLPI